MATFGYETAGVAGFQNLKNAIFGSIFILPKFAIAYSITAYIRWGYAPLIADGAKIKCAIYDSLLNLVTNGETEEWDFPVVATTAGWHTFNFIGEKPKMGAGNYWLVIWQNLTANAVSGLYYDAGDTNQMLDDNEVYNSFPTPTVPDFYYDQKASIYCTYEILTEYTAVQINEQELTAVQSNE